MWARSEYDVEEPARPRRRDELQELLAGLNVPLAVAAVTYASGCRVRRVRVRRRAHEKEVLSPGSGQGERPPVVILSRRTLEELRQAAAKEKEQRPTVRSSPSDVPRRPDADASQQLHAARI